MPASDHKRRLTAFVVAMAVLIATPLAVVATDAFTDVSESSVHHDNITWLKDAGVTSGCNPPDNDEYCPGDNVTRAQMATFMRNLAENQVVDAATAATAVEAETAGDADTVDGAHAADLESTGLLAFNDTNVSLTAGDTTEVLTLELPPGAYLVVARGDLNNNAGTEQSASCSMEVGLDSAASTTFFLGPNTTTGDKEGFTMMLMPTLEASGEAVLSCTASAGWSGNVTRPQIAAVSLQSAETTVLGTAGSGGDDDQ